MPGRSLERLQGEALAKRVKLLEEELERVKGLLRVIEAEMEEATSRLAVLEVRLHDLKLEVGEGRGG